MERKVRDAHFTRFLITLLSIIALTVIAIIFEASVFEGDAAFGWGIACFFVGMISLASYGIQIHDNVFYEEKKFFRKKVKLDEVRDTLNRLDPVVKEFLSDTADIKFSLIRQCLADCSEFRSTIPANLEFYIDNKDHLENIRTYGFYCDIIRFVEMQQAEKNRLEKEIRNANMSASYFRLAGKYGIENFLTRRSID